MDIGAWYAFLAPAGTPKDVVSKLNETVATILSDPEIQKDFHEPWVAASEKLAGAVCGLDTKRKRSHGVDHQSLRCEDRIDPRQNAFVWADKASASYIADVCFRVVVASTIAGAHDSN